MGSPHWKPLPSLPRHQGYSHFSGAPRAPHAPDPQDVPLSVLSKTGLVFSDASTGTGDGSREGDTEWSDESNSGIREPLSKDGAFFALERPLVLGSEGLTTLMIRNIPEKYTRDCLAAVWP